MFPPIRYLEWMWEREADVDLGSSGLGGREPGIIPDRLHRLPDPPEETELDSQIAAQYGDAVSPENVLVTAGTTHANVIAFATALGRESPDEAGTGSEFGESAQMVVERPAYEPLVATPAGLGAEIRRVERDPDRGYSLDPAALGDAIGEQTVTAVLSNRHNPSGHLASREALRAFAGQTRAGGARLLVDEVYAPYLPTAADGSDTAFGGPTAAGLDGAVVTTSLTKFFGFGGLRIGWLIADTEFVDAARSVSAHLPDVAGPSRALAKRAFHNLDRLVKRSRERVSENASLLQEFSRGRSDLRGSIPEGSTYGFLGYEMADGDRVVEAAEEAGILVVPGRFFGDPDRFRLSVSGAPDEMQAALEQFGDVLDDLRSDGA